MLCECGTWTCCAAGWRSWSLAEVNGRMILGPTKTHSRRLVPVPRFLCEDLTALLTGKGPDDLVFTSRHGGPLRSQNFRRRVWLRAIQETGLDRLCPHDLRHTAASLAVSSGGNVKAVQRMHGHKSAAMTLDVYANLFSDDLDRLADRLDAAGSDSRTASRRPESSPTVVALPTDR